MSGTSEWRSRLKHRETLRTTVSDISEHPIAQSEYLKIRDRMKDLSVDWKIILK
jgi:hypothetical protein